MPIEVTSLTGDEIKPVLPALAKLRIIVFRDWPYLYDGTIEYEEKYLAKFAAAKGAVCVVARDGDEVVGASTGAPMIEHADEFAAPFEKAGYDLSKIFYCGESDIIRFSPIFIIGFENWIFENASSSACHTIRIQCRP